MIILLKRISLLPTASTRGTSREAILRKSNDQLKYATLTRGASLYRVAPPPNGVSFGFIEAATLGSALAY